jgi:hypothetical protein
MTGAVTIYSPTRGRVALTRGSLGMGSTSSGSVAIPVRTIPITVIAMPMPVNLVIYQGDTFDLDITITDPADPEGDEIVLDLTGLTAQAQIRLTQANPLPMATFMAEADGNTVSLHLDAVQSAGMRPGRSVWDCQLSDEDGQVMTLCYGTAWITAEVTR